MMLLKIKSNHHLNIRYLNSLSRGIYAGRDDQNSSRKLLCSNQSHQIHLNQIRNFSFDPIQWSISLNTELRNSFYVDYTMKFLTNVHDSLGIPWSLEIVLISLAIRGLFMLPVSVYERRLTAKMDVLHGPEVEKKINEIKELTRRKLQLRELRSEKEAKKFFNKRKKELYNEFYLKYNMHPTKRIIAILAPAPIWMVMSFSIGNLCRRTPASLLEKRSIVESIAANYPQLSTEGFLWFKDLTQPDPSCILPFVFFLTLFASIEYNVLTRRINLVDDTFKVKLFTNIFRGIALILSLTSFVTPSVSLSLL